jgi:ribonuclease P protein component
LFKFPRTHRLTLPAQYTAVLNVRTMVRGPRFALHCRPNGLTVWRLGLVISKRFAARAVERNVLKRTWREAFRLATPQLAGLSAGPSAASSGADSAGDLVVRLLPPAGGAVKKKRQGPKPVMSLGVLRQQCRDEATLLMKQMVSRLAPVQAGPEQKTAQGCGMTGEPPCASY